MSQIAVKVLLQFCSLALQLRGLHYGGVPLGLKTTGRLLLSVHSDFLSEQLAFWLRAGKSWMMFPPGSDRAAL